MNVNITNISNINIPDNSFFAGNSKSNNSSFLKPPIKINMLPEINSEVSKFREEIKLLQVY